MQLIDSVFPAYFYTFYNVYRTEQLKIVFAHIALADKGNWTCEATEGGLHSKSFDLIVYRKYRDTLRITRNTFINFALYYSILKQHPHTHRENHVYGEGNRTDGEGGTKCYHIM